MGASAMYATFWSLVPPVIAIVLALITREVYSSLFVGILFGGLFYSGFSFVGTFEHVLNDGFITCLSDSYNVGTKGGLPASYTAVKNYVDNLVGGLEDEIDDILEEGV